MLKEREANIVERRTEPATPDSQGGLSFFLYMMLDPLASIIGRCTLYTPS